MQTKYLIQNKWARWAVRCVDFLCALRTIGLKRGAPIPRPQTILLSNLGHIGDVILMTSLLPILKQAFPQVRIGILIGSWAQEIVKFHPLIDYIHILDHWQAMRTGERFWQKIRRAKASFQSALRTVREIRYEVFLECRAHFPSAISLAYRARIPARIGYTAPGFGPFLTHALAWVEPKGSIMEPILGLLTQFMGVPSDSLKPHVPIPSSLDFPLPHSYLVIHMGSGQAIREWPLVKWKELCQRLIQAGHQLLFTGKGAKEAKDIEWVSKGLPATINLCDQLAGEDWAFVVKKGRLVVSVDTGIGHLAAATDTPSVLIYHGIHPLGLWKPLSSQVEIVMHPTSCHPCRLSRGCSLMSCVREVSIDAVYAAIQKSLV